MIKYLPWKQKSLAGLFLDHAVSLSQREVTTVGCVSFM